MTEQFRWELDISSFVQSLRQANEEIDRTIAKSEELGESTTAGLNDAKDAADDAGDALGDMGEETKDAGDIGEAAGATLTITWKKVAVAAAAAAAAVAAVVHETIEFADEVNLVAKRAATVGASVEDFQKVQGALDLMTDGSARAEMALINLNRKIDDARTKGGAAADQLARMGLDARDLAELDVDERLLAVADGIATLGDRAAQTAVAADLMGRAGRAMVDSFAKGREPFQESFKLIEQAGIISNETAKEAEALADAVYLLQQAWRSFRSAALEPLIPRLTATLNFLTGLVAHSDDNVVALGKLNQRLGETAEEFGDAEPVVEGFSEAVGVAVEQTNMMAEAARSMAAQAAKSFGILEHQELLDTLDAVGTGADRFEVLEQQIVRMTRPTEAAADDMASSFQDMEQAIVQAVLDGTRLVEDWQALMDAMGAPSPAAVQSDLELYAAAIVTEYRRAWESSTEVVQKESGKQSRALEKAQKELLKKLQQQAQEHAEAMAEVWRTTWEGYIPSVERVVDESEAIWSGHQQGVTDISEATLTHWHAQVEGFLEELGAVSGAMNGLTQGAFDNISAITDLAMAKSAEGTKAYEDAVRAQFAVAVAGALASTTVAMVQAAATWASSEQDWKSGLAAVGVAIGEMVGLLATIGAAEAEFNSKFHAGGVIRQDEIPATLQQGESVLTKQATRALGEQRVNDLNRGVAAGGREQLTVVQQVNNRTTYAAQQEAIRTGADPYSAKIAAMQPSKAYLRNPFAEV